MRWAFPIFALSITGSAGFAACSSLKAAPVAEDGGVTPPPGSEPGGPDGTAADGNDGVVDAHDEELTDASDPRYAYCTTVGAVCSCQSFGFELDSSSCTAAAFPSGFCCADPGWPAKSDSTCTCGAWSCHPTSSGSVCGTFEGGTPGATCSDNFCCAHPTVGTCGCADASAGACPSAFADANNIPVTSCNYAGQPCPRGGTRVTSCTP